MKRVLTIFFIMFLLVPKQVLAEWSKTNTALEIGYAILLLADWNQTKQIAKNPEIYHERNPLFSRHPSVSEVNWKFAVGLIGHIGISALLPNKYKVIWQSTTIAMETVCVSNNYNIGISVDF